MHPALRILIDNLPAAHEAETHDQGDHSPLARICGISQRGWLCGTKVGSRPGPWGAVRNAAFGLRCAVAMRLCGDIADAQRMEREAERELAKATGTEPGLTAGIRPAVEGV